MSDTPNTTNDDGDVDLDALLASLGGDDDQNSEKKDADDGDASESDTDTGDASESESDSGDAPEADDGDGDATESDDGDAADDGDVDLDALLASLGDDDNNKSEKSADSDSDSGDSDDSSKSAASDGDSDSDDGDAADPSSSDSADSAETDLDALLAGLGGDDSDSGDSSGSSSSSTDSDDDDTPARPSKSSAAAPAKSAPPAPPATALKPSLSATFGVRSAPKANPNAKTPLILALLGDFSGRASRGLSEPLAGRKGHTADFDTYDDLYSAISPSLSIEDPGVPGTFVELDFSEIDDFHPDQLIKKIPGLRDLRALRPQLLNSATAPKAAKTLETLLGVPLPPPPRRSTAARAGETPAQTLARLLGTSTEKTAAATGVVANIARQAVAGNTTPNVTDRQKNLVETLDKACAERLRAVLANPRFQALESAWRSLDALIHAFDDGDRIKLLVYDISKDELAADFAPPPPADSELADSDADAPDAETATAAALAAANIADDKTGLHKMLRDTTAEAPWLAAFILHTFGDSPADLALTGRIASVFALSKTPVIAAGHPFALGCASFASQPDPDNWARVAKTEVGAALRDLRASPAAAWLALALPRVLLRLPYGKTSEPIDTFAFEEIVSPVEQHEQFLWGNPVAQIARMYIERFKRDGWKMDAAAGQTVGDLPVYAFKDGKDSLMIPCAEAWLTERAGVAISQQGYIPILSIKNSDTVRIGAITSMSSDGSALQLRLPQ
jgi:type VI secretion system ImpB/VipA family protein